MKIEWMGAAPAAALMTGLMLAACSPAPAAPIAAATPEARMPTPEEIIARGKYIVEGVGLCNDCHTPRLPDGSVDMTRQLVGAPNDTRHLSPMPWADYAPALAGLPGVYTQASLATFLMDGTPGDDSPPRPPMPPYRMNPEDAVAVASYIASLPKPEPAPVATPAK